MTNFKSSNSGIPRRFTERVSLALFVGLAAASVQGANVILNHPRDTNPVVWASQNATSGAGNYATSYDNFRFDTEVTITDLHWSGGYYNPSSQGTITGFTIQIWADNNGQPGGSLRSETHAGTAGETSNPCANWVCFDYGLDLDAPFYPDADTAYWVSIVANTGPNTPQWGWATGSGGDGKAYQDFQGSRAQQGVDFAFQLTGSREGGGNVPEPATLALLGIGIAGMGLMRRKAR